MLTVEGKEARKFDIVLMSIGRAPVTDKLGLDKVKISTDKAGFLGVDTHYRTSAANIFGFRSTNQLGKSQSLIFKFLLDSFVDQFTAAEFFK